MKKKTLLIISYEYPPVGGGAANACSHYAKRLAKRGNQVIILTSAYKELPESETNGNLTIIRIPCMRALQHKSDPFEMLVFILSAFFNLGTIVERYRPHHALIFFVSPFGVLGLALKTFWNIPYSVFARGGDVPGFVDITNTYHLLLMPLTKLIVRQANNIFTNGMYLKQLTDNLLKEGESISIPNGLERSAARIKITGERLQLLFVGRMVQSQKNFLILPEILKNLQDIEIDLYVVGDGPDLYLLQAKLNEYGLSNQVRILKWLEKDKLQEYYNLCDILIFPSWVEGVSNVLVEAIASGLYVLANDIPDTRFFIEETGRGRLIHNNNLKEYLAAIRELDEDRSPIEQAISYELLAKLSWENSTDELEKYLLSEQFLLPH